MINDLTSARCAMAVVKFAKSSHQSFISSYIIKSDLSVLLWNSIHLGKQENSTAFLAYGYHLDRCRDRCFLSPTS